MNIHLRAELADRQLAKIAAREATVGVIGLGYVGLPLAVACAKSGFATIGFDIDAAKKASIERGESYIDSVGSREIADLTASGSFAASMDFAQLGDCDIVVICVPTPLGKHREPDMQFVTSTARTIADNLRRFHKGEPVPDLVDLEQGY